MSNEQSSGNQVQLEAHFFFQFKKKKNKNFFGFTNYENITDYRDN